MRFVVARFGDICVRRKGIYWQEESSARRTAQLLNINPRRWHDYYRTSISEGRPGIHADTWAVVDTEDGRGPIHP